MTDCIFTGCGLVSGLILRAGPLATQLAATVFPVIFLFCSSLNSTHFPSLQLSDDCSVKETLFINKYCLPSWPQQLEMLWGLQSSVAGRCRYLRFTIYTIFTSLSLTLNAGLYCCLTFLFIMSHYISQPQTLCPTKKIRSLKTGFPRSLNNIIFFASKPSCCDVKALHGRKKKLLCLKLRQ